MKFSKRLVSPISAPNGKLIHKASGHNDVGLIIKGENGGSALLDSPEKQGKKHYNGDA